MKPAPFDYCRPSTVTEALEALSSAESSRVLAGGQSLVPAMNFRLTDVSLLVDINRIEGLASVDCDPGGVTVGAAATQTRVLEHEGAVRALIVGGNPGNDVEMERLKSLSAELGIADSVTFTGSVPQAVLPTYYSAADVFTLPSHSESFGLAPLEAMACGAPVVVSRVGGLKTFVRSGENGYLVPWRCPESFAQRFDTLLANPELRDAMGRAARERALSMGWGAVAERMLSYYATRIESVRDTWGAIAGD